MWIFQDCRPYAIDPPNHLRLLEAAKDAEFTPFPRLPVELRYKIPSPRLPELLFHAYINPKLDQIHMSCIYKPLCPTLLRAHLNRLEKLSIRTCFEWGHDINTPEFCRVPKFAFSKPYPSPDMVEHRTLGNFLFYVQPRYFPNLRTLTVHWGRRQVYLQEIADNKSHSVRATTVFRNKENGNGLRIEGLFDGNTFGGLRVRFLTKNEVARYGDCQPAAKHDAWLECVGVTLWSIMRPECFLDEDGVTEYLTQHQHHQLL
ncbi:hypothetical protein PG996_014181 [Apiospora saccharicola]|uniref:F-box domain-containing protein n=1 Tax=Apiospora saccharicola TaxID=335842 RepID=A0ABR1TIB4_9PEZI